jgi:hypothetical protein
MVQYLYILTSTYEFYEHWIILIELTWVINKSFENGELPWAWKDSLETPIFKKGDPENKEIYRPVSCLSVASKVHEKILCDQVTKLMETHKLLPDNQHGFRE